jgi:hypothetical protein
MTAYYGPRPPRWTAACHNWMDEDDPAHGYCRLGWDCGCERKRQEAGVNVPLMIGLGINALLWGCAFAVYHWLT